MRGVRKQENVVSRYGMGQKCSSFSQVNELISTPTIGSCSYNIEPRIVRLSDRFHEKPVSHRNVKVHINGFVSNSRRDRESLSPIT